MKGSLLALSVAIALMLFALWGVIINSGPNGNSEALGGAAAIFLGGLAFTCITGGWVYHDWRNR